MPKPKIDEEKCINCGKCMEVCPAEVFEKDGDKIIVANPDACIACRACEVNCPKEAIKLIE